MTMVHYCSVKRRCVQYCSQYTCPEANICLNPVVRRMRSQHFPAHCDDERWKESPGFSRGRGSIMYSLPEDNRVHQQCRPGIHMNENDKWAIGLLIFAIISFIYFSNHGIKW